MNQTSMFEEEVQDDQAQLSAQWIEYCMSWTRTKILMQFFTPRMITDTLYDFEAFMMQANRTMASISITAKKNIAMLYCC